MYIGPKKHRIKSKGSEVCEELGKHLNHWAVFFAFCLSFVARNTPQLEKVGYWYASSVQLRHNGKEFRAAFVGAVGTVHRKLNCTVQYSDALIDKYRECL